MIQLDEKYSVELSYTEWMQVLTCCNAELTKVLHVMSTSKNSMKKENATVQYEKLCYIKQKIMEKVSKYNATEE